VLCCIYRRNQATPLTIVARAALRTPLTTIKQMEAAARRKSLRSAQRGSGGSSGSKAKRRLSHVLSSPATIDAIPGATSRKQVRHVPCSLQIWSQQHAMLMCRQGRNMLSTHTVC